MAIYHSGIKISNLSHNGKQINKIFHNGKCIYAYTSITVGESLYNGIPSNGIMLYGNVTGDPSSNPLGIQGDSINLNAPLSSCPHGIKIHFSNISYQDNGSELSSQCSIPDIRIPKGSSSGSSPIQSFYDGSIDNNITASINGSALSFFVNNQVHTGTVTSQDPDEILAIASITAY